MLCYLHACDNGEYFAVTVKPVEETTALNVEVLPHTVESEGKTIEDITSEVNLLLSEHGLGVGRQVHVGVQHRCIERGE